VANDVSHNSRRGLLLVSPPFLTTLILLAGPLGAIILFSFWTQDYLTLNTDFTIKNYVEAAQDPIYGLLLGRSLLVAGAVTLLTVITAFPVAYFISFHVKPSRKSLWLFLITIPFWTSYLIRVFLWKVVLGFNGVINSGLIELGIIDAPITFILYNLNAVIITLAHAFAPFAILPIFVAWKRLTARFWRPHATWGNPRGDFFPRHASTRDAGRSRCNTHRVHTRHRRLYYTAPCWGTQRVDDRKHDPDTVFETQ
jgi:spermidine/putrescine transport system permease protein